MAAPRTQIVRAPSDLSEKVVWGAGSAFLVAVVTSLADGKFDWKVALAAGVAAVVGYFKHDTLPA